MTKYSIDLRLALSACVVWWSAGQACGQAPDVWKKAKDVFSDAPAVYLKRSHDLNLVVEGDSLIASTEVVEDVIHLRENTGSVAQNRVYGNHFSEVSGLKASTLVWDKNRYRENDVTAFRKNSNRDQSIFFDDSYYYSFDYPSVSMHNRTVLKYRHRYREVRFVPGFIFGSYLPQLESVFTIRAQKGVELRAEVLNDPDRRVHMTRKEQGNYVVYTYRAENVPAIQTMDDAPEIRHYVPHLVLYIKSYQGKSGRQEVLPNLDALNRTYWSYVDGINKDPGPELPKVVEQLKAGSKSELDLVRNIFYWVQDNIQYVAFEDGMRGFIPHSGAYTCEKKYGDCKDMANIIVDMLQLAGITAYHTWIGTRDLPYAYTDWPSPIVDNHMIATYVAPSGEYYFLDGTSQYTPLGFPSAMIQGKEALIARGPDQYEVRQVPVMDPERNRMIDSVIIRVEQSAVAGTGLIRLSGYPKIFGDRDLDQLNPDALKTRVTRMVLKGSNKFILNKYAVSHQRDRDQPTEIAYDFEVQDYVQKAGGDIFINLNLNKDFYGALINRATRPIPKEARYRYMDTHYTVLEVPEGYEVTDLPSNSVYEGKFLSHNLHYTREDNRIVLSRTLVLNYLMLQPGDFEAWNADVRKLSECYKETLLLRKK